MTIPYRYIVQEVSDNENVGYEAYIPKLKSYVYADSFEELKEALVFAIESEQKKRSKEGKSMPPPDQSTEYSGNFVLRIDPILHKNLSLAAEGDHMSLNKYIEQELAKKFRFQISDLRTY